MNLEAKQVLTSEQGNSYEAGLLEEMPNASFLETVRQEEYANFTSNDKFAICDLDDGMAVGQHVMINKTKEIDKYIYRSHEGKVFSIVLMKDGSFGYEYVLCVYAQGPATGWFSDAGLKLYFIDGAGDKYSLDIVSTTKKVHTLRYNSDKPNIKCITWENS